jgi:hypothetical protein
VTDTRVVFSRSAVIYHRLRRPKGRQRRSVNNEASEELPSEHG